MIKTAVIGVGNIGKHHARIYSSLPYCELVAVSDINEMLAEKHAKKYHARFYRDYRQLIKNEKPDVISVCVPTFLHYELTKYCIKMGLNTLVEKPITAKIEDAVKLLNLAKKYKRILLVGHVERYNPVVIKVKEMIERGDLGRITAIMARRVGGFPPQIKDANISVDLAIHDIDVINYLLNEIPIEISVNKQKNHLNNREDSVEFFLKYKKTSAYIQANWITPVKVRKLNITGTEGYLEMDYVSQKIEFYKSNYKKFKDSSGDFSDFVLKFSQPDKIDVPVVKKEPLKEEIIYFLDSVIKKRKIDSNFALEALKISLV